MLVFYSCVEAAVLKWGTERTIYNVLLNLVRVALNTGIGVATLA